MRLAMGTKALRRADSRHPNREGAAARKALLLGSIRIVSYASLLADPCHSCSRTPAEQRYVAARP